MMIREVMSHRQNKCNQHIKLQKQAGSTKQLRRNLIGMQATDQGQWHDHSVPSIRHQLALWLAPKIQRQAIESIVSLVHANTEKNATFKQLVHHT